MVRTERCNFVGGPWVGSQHRLVVFERYGFEIRIKRLIGPTQSGDHALEQCQLSVIGMAIREQRVTDIRQNALKELEEQQLIGSFKAMYRDLMDK